MFNELTAKLLRRRQEKDQAAARTQEQIVADVADEKLADPDQILDALEQVGMTPLVLQEGVQDLLHRRELQVVLKNEPALRKRADALNTKLEKAKAEFLAAKGKWRTAQDENSAELSGVQSKLSQIENAKHLLRSSPPMEVKEALDDASRELSRLNSRRTRLIGLLDDGRSFYLTSRNGNECRESTFVARRTRLKSEIARCSAKHSSPADRGKLSVMETELAKLARERKAAERELASLEKKIAKQNQAVKIADRELILA